MDLADGGSLQTAPWQIQAPPLFLFYRILPSADRGAGRGGAYPGGAWRGGAGRRGVWQGAAGRRGPVLRNAEAKWLVDGRLKTYAFLIRDGLFNYRELELRGEGRAHTSWSGL